MTDIPHFYTVKQFCEKHRGRWPNEGVVRHLYRKSKVNKNKFQKAFKRVGLRLLVNEKEFWKCVEEL